MVTFSPYPCEHTCLASVAHVGGSWTSLLSLKLLLWHLMCSVKISNDNNNNNKNDDDDDNNNNNNNNRDNNLIDTSRIIRIEECIIGGH